MGERGPVPKRSDQRRRRNKSDTTTTTTDGAKQVIIPPADDTWHPIALWWYLSLAESGQSRYYEPSDWATAYLVAESLSRDLSPQVVGIVQQGPTAGEIVRDVIPLKGASMGAYMRAFTVLLVTEGDRRRVQLELERPTGPDPEDERAAGVVVQLKQVLGSGG